MDFRDKVGLLRWFIYSVYEHSNGQFFNFSEQFISLIRSSSQLNSEQLKNVL